MREFGVEKEKPCCNTSITITEDLYNDYIKVIESHKGDIICRDCRKSYNPREIIDHIHICRWNQ